MTGFLASVTSVEEARLVIDVADIIDLKNPSQGALGALPHATVEAVVRYVDGHKPVSATVGDLPMVPEVLCEAVAAMAATGVNIVKVGFFGFDHHVDCAKALSVLTTQCNIVAVMFADQKPEFSMIPVLADAGFHGVMLDTADKSVGGLRHWLDDPAIQQFVDMAVAADLLTGLAGALRSADISALSEINPDYLGFRGALCRNHVRHSVLEREKAIAIAGLLRECNSLKVQLVN